MRNVTYLRLLVALLDAQNNVKALALAEGQPRYACRRAIEQATQLCATHKVEGPRLVIVPAGHGSMAAAVDRVKAFAKDGQAIDGLERDQVREMGRKAAFVAFCGILAEQERAARAKAVQGQRLG